MEQQPNKSLEKLAEDLSAPFEPHDLDWLPKAVRKDRDGKHIALALPYVNADAVMERLDQVAGPFGWALEHYTVNGGTVACRISLLNPITNEWVSKSNGAGPTKNEPEKGALSGAIKRAGGCWGIGRYLKALDKPWCRAEVYSGNDGKPRFKKWIGDPYEAMMRLNGGGAPPAQQPPPQENKRPNPSEKPKTLAEARSQCWARLLADFTTPEAALRVLTKFGGTPESIDDLTEDQVRQLWADLFERGKK